jgi:hypothetical protein
MIAARHGVQLLTGLLPVMIYVHTQLANLQRPAKSLDVRGSEWAPGCSELSHLSTIFGSYLKHICNCVFALNHLSPTRPSPQNIAQQTNYIMTSRSEPNKGIRKPRKLRKVFPKGNYLEKVAEAAQANSLRVHGVYQPTSGESTGGPPKPGDFHPWAPRDGSLEDDNMVDDPTAQLPQDVIMPTIPIDERINHRINLHWSPKTGEQKAQHVFCWSADAASRSISATFQHDLEKLVRACEKIVTEVGKRRRCYDYFTELLLSQMTWENAISADIIRMPALNARVRLMLGRAYRCVNRESDEDPMFHFTDKSVRWDMLRKAHVFFNFPPAE